jgi:hypothetical protein
MVNTTASLLPRRIVLFAAAAFAALALLGSAVSAPEARADAQQYTTYVKAGDYRTLDTLWNTTATFGFMCPYGAKIRVVYGYGWFSASRQNQTLDCIHEKTIEIGAWSKVGARVQIKVPESGYVTWGRGFQGPNPG